MKEEVKTHGTQQARRLERSMCAQRRWSAASFGTFLVKHRLLGHFARRLVFAVVDGPPFRVAEDGTYADAAEHVLPVPPEAQVVIAHPVMMDEPTRARWREIFLDYKILQPFPQVEREILELAPDELHGTRTLRFSGVKTRSRRFWGLKHRGWELGYHPTKRFDGNVRATLTVTPGLSWYERGSNNDEDHELGELSLLGVTFAALPRIARAELLRDVEDAGPSVDAVRPPEELGEDVAGRVEGERGAPMPPVRARSHPKRSDGKKTAKRAGTGTVT